MIINTLKFPLIFVAAFIALFLIAIPYYSGDVKNHVAWVNSLTSFGALNFYEREISGYYTPNYPPLTVFLFLLSEGIYQGIIFLTNWANTIVNMFPSQLVYFVHWENVRYAFYKIFPILGNLLIFAGIYKLLILDKLNHGKSFLIATIFLFNPAVIYVSAVWGQVDFLPLVFIIFAIYFFFKDKVYISSLCLVFALLTKQTAVIFLPIFLFLIFNKYGFKAVIKNILLIVLIFYISFLPFHQFSIVWPFQFYLLSFDSVAKTVGENVFNFWGAIFEFTNPSDESLFLVLTYRQWGILLFTLFMVYPTYLFLKKDKSLKNILIFLSVVSLSYFFFFTRLHERHLAPAILFLSTILYWNKKFWIPLIFITVLYMLNLYSGSPQPNIEIFNEAIKNNLLIKVLIGIYFATTVYIIYLFRKEKS